MQKIEARNKEKLLWEWQQLQLSCTLRNKRSEPCRGLVPTTMKNGKDFKINIRAPCSSQVVEKSSQERRAFPENGGVEDFWCWDDGDILAVTAFGKPDLAILIWPHLAKPNLANTIFGQS